MKMGGVMVLLVMMILVFSSHMDTVQSDAADCLDACSTACVQRDTRLMARCDRKCQIRCGPGLDSTVKEEMLHLPLITQGQWDIGGSSKAKPDQIRKAAGPPLFVDHPAEGNAQQNRTLATRLDLATERDLILTWNARCSLKRGRGECEEIEEVEQELFRRKRNKKEEWYDEEGNLLMVKVSTVQGSQTYMIDEWGDLTPPSM